MSDSISMRIYKKNCNIPLLGQVATNGAIETLNPVQLVDPVRDQFCACNEGIVIAELVSHNDRTPLKRLVVLTHATPFHKLFVNQETTHALGVIVVTDTPRLSAPVILPVLDASGADCLTPEYVEKIIFGALFAEKVSVTDIAQDAGFKIYQRLCVFPRVV